jgi:uncharacterized protein (TIGR00106 family)
MEFSMSPAGKSGSLAPYVARILSIVQASGLPYQFTAMGTIVEGEWQQVMDLLEACHAELRRDSERVSVHVKIDSRDGPAGRLRSKVDSVEQVLGRKLAT